jgi:hypothetical protein
MDEKNWAGRDTCGLTRTCNYKKCIKELQTVSTCFTVKDIIEGINGAV